MPAGKWKAYDSLKFYLGNGTIDPDNHSFQIRLFLSTSNCHTLTNTVLADLTNEHASANGYAPIALTATWLQSTSTSTFDSDNPIWTAVTGNIVARSAVIIRTGTVNGVLNALVGVCLLDNAPADKTVTPGNTLEIRMNPSGIFTLTGATVD